jgi:serine-type D-Ala-D-Ala carboxypeptidase/endopeptidase (penicillin-binding protein 4)
MIVLRTAATAVAALLLVSPLRVPAAAAPAATAATRELDAALGAILEAGPIGGARKGVLVADVVTGEVVFAKDADVLLNPASNVKLVTAAAALARLGPEYRFATELLVDGRSAGSPSVKTLYLRGKGDPTLVTERLWAIAGDLVHLGVKRIGDLVVDDSFFDDVRSGPGFDQETGDRSYLAPASAASLNWNTVAVHVGPGGRKRERGRVAVEPSSEFFEIVNRTTTVAASARRHVTISSVPSAGKQRIVVEGRVPLGSRPQAAWKKIDDPPLYLGHTLRRLLELRGIAFTGSVRVGPVPAGSKLVHVVESESLGEIARRLNKSSNNFVAEQLLKTLGAEAKGAPGTWSKGVAAVEEFLAEVGVPRGSYVMRNGSGLNDANRFSARQVVTLLRAMWARFPLQAEFVASLPVAGRDGTIRWRMEGTEAVGRLRAKTGTLESVTSLSGYVQTAGGRTLAFAVLVNDYAGRAAGVVRSVDALGGALAASGGAPGALGAAVALARGTSPAAAPVAAPADLAPVLRTYYALGRAGDQRNLQLLRTALRTETEPALQLAIAECVYLSDPGEETSRRTFLDAIPADPQLLARLWLAGADEEPRPVLSSLGDLAAEGIPEALVKLVEIAPASAADGSLAAALADVVAAVAAAAPEELVRALRAAPASSLDAAIGVLGVGLARSDEPDHPLREALRVSSRKDGEAGAFARALQPRLAEAVAAGAAARAAPMLVPTGGSVPAGPVDGGL